MFLRMFTRSEIEEIRRVTLWDVIVNSTRIAPDSVQRNVFVWEEGDPCPQPSQLNATMLEPCVPLQRYDYFEVIFSFTILRPTVSRNVSLTVSCIANLIPRRNYL